MRGNGGGCIYSLGSIGLYPAHELENLGSRKLKQQIFVAQELKPVIYICLHCLYLPRSSNTEPNASSHVQRREEARFEERVS